MEFHVPNFKTIRFIDRMMAVGERHLRGRGFVRVTVPRIVPASGACENVDSLFEIGMGGDSHWFGEGTKRAYFAQTGQLYLESLLGNGFFKKVYCVGPSGRAEAKVDTRHLTEFEMVEIEFHGTFDELLQEIESFINALVADIKEIPANERADYDLPVDLAHLKNHPTEFPKIRYQDAITELGLNWGDDISSKQEQRLITNHGGGPILITRYPNPEHPAMKEMIEGGQEDLAIKFFNMQPDPEDPRHVLSADCVVPYGGECVGSAARVWKYEEFKNRLFSSAMFKRLKEKDQKAEEGFAWYLGMLKQYPSIQHSGCGFGMSRIFQYLLGETDITKAVTFPSNRARIY